MSEDLISRQDAINALDCINGVEEVLRSLPSAQPAIEILAWLLAYHKKAFELHGRYMAHEVIGWLVHDFTQEFIGDQHDGMLQ